MNAADLIKECESCRLKAYLDGAGVPTIGWGSTGKDIKMGLTWTQQQCDERFNADLMFFSTQLRSFLEKPANENQLAAMCSLAYNIGLNAFKKSTVLNKFNSGDLQAAADAFLMWDKITVSGTKVESPGLLNRRVKERSVFLS